MPLQWPAGTGHAGICKVLWRINAPVRVARITDVLGQWKPRTPKATGGAEGPHWLSAQDSGQGTESHSTQLAQPSLTSRSSFYLEGVAVEQQVASKLGLQMWLGVLLMRCILCYTWPPASQHDAIQTGSYYTWELAHAWLPLASSVVSHYWLSYLQFSSFMFLKVPLAGMNCGSNSDYSRVSALHIKSPAISV